jgi:hypothetical protein
MPPMGMPVPMMPAPVWPMSVPMSPTSPVYTPTSSAPAHPHAAHHQAPGAESTATTTAVEET